MPTYKGKTDKTSLLVWTVDTDGNHFNNNYLGHRKFRKLLNSYFAHKIFLSRKCVCAIKNKIHVKTLPFLTGRQLFRF